MKAGIYSFLLALSRKRGMPSLSDRSVQSSPVKVFVLFLLLAFPSYLWADDERYRHAEKNMYIEFSGEHLRFVTFGINNAWFRFQRSGNRIIVQSGGPDGGDIILRMNGDEIISDDILISGRYRREGSSTSVSSGSSASESLTCISGDCVNGRGIASFNGGRIEAIFVSGKPSGRAVLTIDGEGASARLEWIFRDKNFAGQVAVKMRYANGVVLDGILPNIDAKTFPVHVWSPGGQSFSGIYDFTSKEVWDNETDSNRRRLCVRERAAGQLNLVCQVPDQVRLEETSLNRLIRRLEDGENIPRDELIRLLKELPQ